MGGTMIKELPLNDKINRTKLTAVENSRYWNEYVYRGYRIYGTSRTIFNCLSTVYTGFYKVKFGHYHELKYTFWITNR